MRKIYNIPIESTIPFIDAILNAQGIPHLSAANDRSRELAQQAITIYRQNAEPIGLFMEIMKDEFEIIFNGDGRNEVNSPVKPIYEQAEELALFTVTIEENICSDIKRFFDENDFAIGSMLDSAASEGTEMAAQSLQNIYRQHLINIGRFNSHSCVLRFSPGYCGWHISGQRKLFQHLHPEDIGITLNQSFLMQPLKSISGVFISGKKEIFQFDDTFSFCRECAIHMCRERIKAVLEK